MKTYRLTTDIERIAGIAFSVVITAAMVLLLYALRNDTTVLIMTAVFALLLIAALAYYVISAAKAACVPDPANRQLHVKGVRNYTLDLSSTATLETVAVKNGHTTSRIMVFRDAEGNVTGTVPTLFTYRQGVQAEPMAIQIAQDLGLDFIANVQPWEYDKEKAAEHDKQVALEEKEAEKQRKIENKKRRETLMKMRIDKIRKENQEKQK